MRVGLVGVFVFKSVKWVRVSRGIGRERVLKFIVGFSIYLFWRVGVYGEMVEYIMWL